MAKGSTSSIIRVHLEMSEEEATWLKALLQNPLNLGNLEDTLPPRTKTTSTARIGKRSSTLSLPFAPRPMRDFDYSGYKPRTIPTPPGAALAPRKLFQVEGYGTIPEENSLWFSCVDRTALKDMKVGEELYFTFQRGMGKNDALVKRVE